MSAAALLLIKLRKSFACSKKRHGRQSCHDTIRISIYSAINLIHIISVPCVFEFIRTRKIFSCEHIELAKWADAILIAPATANTLAKLAHGLADDLLSTICLASQKPLYLAPAMNQAMWENSITQENLERLKNRGCHILEPATGEQACGDIGIGRMLSPEMIIDHLFTTEAKIVFQSTYRYYRRTHNRSH